VYLTWGVTANRHRRSSHPREVVMKSGVDGPTNGGDLGVQMKLLEALLMATDSA